MNPLHKVASIIEQVKALVSTYLGGRIAHEKVIIAPQLQHSERLRGSPISEPPSS